MNGRAMSSASTLEHVPSILLPSDPSLFWKLTKDEENLISQLTDAYKATQTDHLYIKLTQGTQCLSDDQTLRVIGQMTADMVQFFTAIPDFTAMFHKDQASALRANALSLFLLRNSFEAFQDKEEMELDLLENLNYCFDDSSGSGHSQQLLECISEEGRLVQCLCRFQRALRPIIRHDLATQVLLQCAVVFDSRAPDLWNRQGINSLQDKYVILLKHYMESQCSYLFCWHYVESMLELVDQSKVLAAEIIRLFPAWPAVMDPFINTLSQPVT